MTRNQKWKLVVPPSLFDAVWRAYSEETSFGLALIAGSAVSYNRCSYYAWRDTTNLHPSYDRMVTEAGKWGEPYITIDNRNGFVWCVPVFFNNETVGGLFAAGRASGEPARRSSGASCGRWSCRPCCSSSLLSAGSRVGSEDPGRRSRGAHQTLTVRVGAASRTRRRGPAQPATQASTVVEPPYRCDARSQVV